RTSSPTCRYRRNTRLSLRNGFNAYFALSPVSGLFLPPSPAPEIAPQRKLNTSCEAPGPHDFIVREPLPPMIFSGPRTQPSKVDDNGLLAWVVRAAWVSLTSQTRP